MAATPVTLRCPGCGGYLAALAYPGAPAVYYRCPHCGRPVPVVGPRHVPPLYTWEVYPLLYPAPRSGRFLPMRLGPIVAALLLGALVLLVPVSGWLAWEGDAALAPGTTVVAGEVAGGGGLASPIPNAQVVVYGENGFHRTVYADGAGRFAVAGVPLGGILLNVTAAGYGYTTVQLFASSVYTSPGGTSDLLVTLETSANATDIRSPFPDLATLVSSLWAFAVLGGVAAVLCALGVLRGYALRAPARSVAAGMSALLTPVLAGLLGLADVSSTGFGLLLIAAVLGAIAAAFSTLALARRSSPVTPP